MTIHKDRAKVKSGSITVPNISIQYFKEQLVRRFKLDCQSTDSNETIMEEMDCQAIYSFYNLLTLKHLNPHKTHPVIQVDFENCICTPEDEEVGFEMGFCDLGFPFLGFYVGGDWEQEVYVILYWDGTKFDLYFPYLGNTYNEDFNCAFGSELECEDAIGIGKTHYSQHASVNEVLEALEDRDKLFELYFKAHQIVADPTDFKLEVDRDLLLEDILQTFKVVPCYKSYL